MAETWRGLVEWSEPRSIHSLISETHGRRIIPNDRGYYAFVEGPHSPENGPTLYIGIALGTGGIYQRLSSYLRGTINLEKAKKIKHKGKLRLSYARIKGLSGEGSAERNTAANDKFIHLCWAKAPFIFSGKSEAERAVAYQLERALINEYRPLYNTALWDRDMDFDLDDAAF